MSNNKFSEKDSQETTDSAVDFSDLGPLFAADQPDSPKEAETSAEDTVIFEPDPQPAPEKPAAEDPASEIEEAEDEEDTSVTFEAQEPSAVDFSGLGPLFQEDTAVQAGEAALLLKKLSEMEPVEEEIPEEEQMGDPLAEEAAPVTFEPEKTTEDASPDPVPEDLPAEEQLSETQTPQDAALAETSAEDSTSEAASEEESSQEAPAEEAVPAEAPSQEPEEIPETPSETSPQEAAPVEPAKEVDEKKVRPRPTHKGRPKRKKGEGFLGIPNLLVTVVWIAITVLIGVTLGRMAWICAADVLAFGREDKPVTITIYEADTIEDITRKLHDGGLIHYPGLFKLYASLAVDEGEIHPGIWDLNTRYDYHALVNMMSPTSSREVIELMIPEGYSCRQIFALMEENKICTSLDLGAYAASGELEDYWFLEGVERGDMYCLEGYLFPDTYQFYKNDSPRSVLTKMLDNFNSRFDQDMIAKIDELNAHLADLMRKGGHGDEFIAENKFTVQDVINVASLVEKETSSADEGYVIASVIYNRLFNWPGNVPYLNIDATIVYALGGKNKLTQEDLKVNSPYNTYTHTGLTPGPIANPGLSSIRAALSPSDSNYYYYVLDPALGSHRFSTTYDEHKANIASIGD